MKKLFATLFILLTTVSASALPLGNPWNASLYCDGIFWEGNCSDYCDPCATWCDAWSLRIGIYNDTVDERHMQVDSHDGRASIRNTEIWTNAGFIALNVWDRVDLFGTLGASRLAINATGNPFGSTNGDWLEVVSETDFSWSIGLRGTIWECGCFGLGAEAQYFHTRPNLNYTQFSDNEPVYGSSSDHFKYKEWQIGLGAAYRINIAGCATAAVPYAGITWSRATMDFDNIPLALGGTLFDLRSERDFGYAVGVTLLGCNKWGLSIEWRFVDERAFFIESQLRF